MEHLSKKLKKNAQHAEAKKPEGDETPKIPPKAEKLAKALGIDVGALLKTFSEQQKRMDRIEAMAEENQKTLQEINNLVSQGMEMAKSMGVQVPQQSSGEQSSGSPMGINPRGLPQALMWLKELKGHEPSQLEQWAMESLRDNLSTSKLINQAVRASLIKKGLVKTLTGEEE